MVNVFFFFTLARCCPQTAPTPPPSRWPPPPTVACGGAGAGGAGGGAGAPERGGAVGDGRGRVSVSSQPPLGGGAMVSVHDAASGSPARGAGALGGREGGQHTRRGNRTIVVKEAHKGAAAGVSALHCNVSGGGGLLHCRCRCRCGC